MPRTILDVSKWQGSIDWDKVAASGFISGVMIRAMGNSAEGKPSKPYIDPFFARNYAECTRLGIPVGVYGYFKATDRAQADKELALFKQALSGRTFQLPVAVDIEDKLQAALSKSAAHRHRCPLPERGGKLGRVRHAVHRPVLRAGQPLHGRRGPQALRRVAGGLPQSEARPRLGLRDVAVHQQRQDPRHCQGR